MSSFTKSRYSYSYTTLTLSLTPSHSLINFKNKCTANNKSKSNKILGFKKNDQRLLRVS